MENVETTHLWETVINFSGQQKTRGTEPCLWSYCVHGNGDPGDTEIWDPRHHR